MNASRRRRLSTELYLRVMQDARSDAARPSMAPHFQRRAQITAELGTDQAFPHRVDPLPVTQVTSMDRRGFIEATKGASRPAVFRGFARHTATLWSEDRLRNAIGESECTVMRMTPESQLRGWETGNEHARMTISDLLDRMHDEDLYLNNSTEMFVEHPELMADLHLDRLNKFTTPNGTWDELLTTNFFVGTNRVRSAIHTAFAGNFFINLVGRKRWRFIAPEYTPYLHPSPAKPFDYATSALGGFWASEQEGRDDSIFFRLPWHEVVLEPGDVLYSAPWWWHEVDNMDPLTIATAVRHIQPPGVLTPSFTNCVPMALMSRFPKSRGLMTAHYLKHKLAGGDASLRDRVNLALWQRLQQSLGDR